MSARFVVGIDLGTTNSVVAYADTTTLGDGGEADVASVLPVPQLVKAGLAESRDRLPSFLYLPAANEFPAEPERLGRGAACRGFARNRGAEVPGRLVGEVVALLGRRRPHRVDAAVERA